jgi:hypothetical protein
MESLKDNRSDYLHSDASPQELLDYIREHVESYILSQHAFNILQDLVIESGGFENNPTLFDVWSEARALVDQAKALNLGPNLTTS